MNVADYIAIDEACSRITVSRATLWRMIRRGHFPKPVRISPGRVGVPKDEYDEWDKERRAARARPAAA